jgi:hypothetical protein
VKTRTGWSGGPDTTLRQIPRGQSQEVELFFRKLSISSSLHNLSCTHYSFSDQVKKRAVQRSKLTLNVLIPWDASRSKYSTPRTTNLSPGVSTTMSTQFGQKVRLRSHRKPLHCMVEVVHMRRGMYDLPPSHALLKRISD